MTSVIAYQADMVWGNKLNRVNQDAALIRQEPGWWFNEPMDLPPLLKEPYRKMMDDQNKRLAEKGLAPSPEWAK